MTRDHEISDLSSLVVGFSNAIRLQIASRDSSLPVRASSIFFLRAQHLSKLFLGEPILDPNSAPFLQV